MSNSEITRNVAAYLAHPFLDLLDETYSFSEYELSSIYTFLRENIVTLKK